MSLSKSLSLYKVPVNICITVSISLSLSISVNVYVGVTVTLSFSVSLALSLSVSLRMFLTLCQRVSPCHGQCHCYFHHLTLSLPLFLYFLVNFFYIIIFMYAYWVLCCSHYLDRAVCVCILHQLECCTRVLSRTNQITAFGMYLNPPIKSQHLRYFVPIRASGYWPSCQFCHGIRVSLSFAIESTHHWRTLRKTNKQLCSDLSSEMTHFLYVDLKEFFYYLKVKGRLGTVPSHPTHPPSAKGLTLSCFERASFADSGRICTKH